MTQSSMQRQRARDTVNARLAGVTKQTWSRLEEDFSRRTAIAHLRYVLGDRSPELEENYRVIPYVVLSPTHWYSALMRYPDPTMTLEWVDEYLDKLSRVELDTWMSARYEIIQHMEAELRLGGVDQLNPYLEPYKHVRLELAKLDFRLDHRVVNQRSEHPKNWWIDIEQALWLYPETYDRLRVDVAEGVLPFLLKKLHGPDRDVMRQAQLARRHAKLCESPFAKQVEKDQSAITNAVLKQHDKMFGTNFVPKKSICEAIAAFFKPFFKFRHHEQRND
jgi:hypothetical protein